MRDRRIYVEITQAQSDWLKANLPSARATKRRVPLNAIVLDAVLLVADGNPMLQRLAERLRAEME
jgi:hypothetical protein